MSDLPICTYCNGNDNDMPCAYPSENKTGCLRDKRIRGKTMTKYIKKPIHIEATQWFKKGDHLEVVPYREDYIEGHNKCKRCNKERCTHGWVDTLEGGHIVCPGDFIITGVAGEHYPCKPDIFHASYNEVIDE